MTDAARKPALDADTIAFAGKVFGYARVGNASALEELLGQGMPANLLNDKGDSLLMLAAYNGQVEAVRVLLAHGGDAELVNDRGQLPLGAAAFKGDLAVVEALLDGGARIEGSGPDGRTGLMYAAMFNRIAILELLLARGADRHARDAAGIKAHELAAQMGATDTAARLAPKP